MRKIFAVSFLVVLLTSSILQSVSFAHEAYSPSIRWIDVGTYNPFWPWQSSHKKIKIKCFSTVLGSGYTTAYGNAKNSWNNNSNNYVDIQEGEYSYPDTKCYIYSHVWQSSWPSTWAAYNSVRIRTSDYKIDLSQIYLKDSMMKDWTTSDKQKTIAHEFGHCFGFADTNDGTQSIMKNGKGSTIGYYTPQDHDRSDLASFYP